MPGYQQEHLFLETRVKLSYSIMIPLYIAVVVCQQIQMPVVPEILACGIVLVSLISFKSVLVAGPWIMWKEYVCDSEVNMAWGLLWYLWYFLILLFMVFCEFAEVVVEIQIVILICVIWFN